MQSKSHSRDTTMHLCGHNTFIVSATEEEEEEAQSRMFAMPLISVHFIRSVIWYALMVMEFDRNKRHGHAHTSQTFAQQIQTEESSKPQTEHITDAVIEI